jgi:putative membrane protein insertion efficiency factor
MGDRGVGEHPKASGLAARTSLVLLKGYKRFISPFLGAHCRYVPSCSQYAAEAIGTYGFWRGWWLALKRVGRCHPWAEGGLDPVPLPDGPPYGGGPRS